MNPDIFSYVKEQESAYQTQEIQIGDNWFFNMRRHIQLIFHLKNGVFFTGSNDWLRAFKGIMEPMLNLCNWTEDIELKDVTFFIEGEDNKVLSFLFKKYHDEVYVREYDLDTLFDKITESDNAYGGVILQKGVTMPEVLNLETIAFCDQTEILGGPIGFKYYFSPDKLRGMSEFGWGKDSNGASMSIEELITLATSTKPSTAKEGTNKNDVPGKTIEVYIVRGNLPSHYLNEDNDMENWFNQVQILAFYTDKESKKQGVTLYRKKESEGSIKFNTTSEIPLRALGRGVGETLLPSQIWTNFLTIHKMNMLESASKSPLYTDDPSYTSKNKIQDMENLEITTIDDGKRIFQVPTAAPGNVQMQQNAINEWFEFAQFQASAFNPILGMEATSGTTFRGQERVVAQGKGLHERRKGKRAKFIEEIYRDWIIPDIMRDIKKGKKFLATLSMEELTWVAEQMSINVSNKKIKEDVLNGRIVTQAEALALRQGVKDAVLKKGDKHLIEVIKGEFDDANISIGISVGGKQKDLAQLSDKLLSIFQFIFANPAGFQQAMQIPALARSFENILEFGGMSIANFSSLLQAPAPVQAPQAPGQAPLAQGQPQQGAVPSNIAPLPQVPSAF